MGTPAAEIAIDEALVRRLLEAQHKDLAALRLTPIASGWDNATFRLGDALAVRLPRRAAGAPLVVNEAWLNALAPWLPLPTPATVRTGTPTDFYPWPWRIARWLDGASASLWSTPAAVGEASRLAAFLRALHRSAPANAPTNEVRGIPLAARAPAVEERFARIADAVTPGVRAAWDVSLRATPATIRVWLHGDLHAGNVLVADGAISGIVDWGDICAGDPATDLAAFWMLFEPDAIAAGLKAYGADNALIARARGWAISFGAVLLDTGRVDNPAHAAVGEATLRRAAS